MERFDCTPHYNGHLALIPAFLCSFSLTLLNTGNLVRRTSAGLKGVYLRERLFRTSRERISIGVYIICTKTRVATITTARSNEQNRKNIS